MVNCNNLFQRKDVEIVTGKQNKIENQRGNQVGLFYPWENLFSRTFVNVIYFIAQFLYQRIVNK